MSEYATIFRWTGIVICVFLLCVTGSCQYTKYAIKESIANGAHPMDAACAFKSDGYTKCAMHWLEQD